jgi:uncharacterized protein YdeI (BOF family)
MFTVVAAVPTVPYNWAPVEPGQQVNVTGEVDTDMPLVVVSAVEVPA